MKKILLAILLSFISTSAVALVDLNQQTVGGGSGQKALNLVTTYQLGNNAPVIANCLGGGDESALHTANADAANNTSIMVPYTKINGTPKPCILDAQFKSDSQNSYVSFFNWAGAPTEYNTSIGVVPQMQVHATSILNGSSPGAAAFDMNGPRQWNFNNMNVYADNNSVPITMLENTSTSGQCCASGTLNLTNTSVGNFNAIIGCPVDGDDNCNKAGGVYAGSITDPGAGYANNTYFNVALTGGSGTNAKAASITVAGGVVTNVTMRSGNITYPGGGYAVNDILSAADANLGGGGGSGFQFTVSQVLRATTTNQNILLRANHIQASDIGVFEAANTSDDQVYNSEFSGGNAAFLPIFGGGARQYGMNRFEFLRCGICVGNQNGSSSVGSGMFIVGNEFTEMGTNDAHSTYPLFDTWLGNGDGMIEMGNEHNSWQSSGSPTQIGGSPFATTDVMLSDVYSEGTGPATSCVTIKNSTGAVTPDYLRIGPLICNGSNITSAVVYTNTPAHHIEDTMGPGISQYWDHSGRPWGKGSSAPNSNATMDLGSDTKALIVPKGTTAQRPGTPADGMIRFNTDTPGIEAYYSGAWNALAR